MNTKDYKNSGFTFIELLVAITIMAILYIVIAPSVI